MTRRVALVMSLSIAILALFMSCLFTVSVVRAEPFTMRVTFYTLRGTMYSGYQTQDGAAACSWVFPIGSQFEFADGRVVTCLDRGMGDHYWPDRWLDVWAPSYSWGIQNIERQYGIWADVTLIRWGWGDTGV